MAFKNKVLREFRFSEYPQGWWFQGKVYETWNRAITAPQGVMSFCKFRPDDILYVRETWAQISDWTDIDPELGEPDGYIYRADWADGEENPCWHPSIHMPKEAARLFLRVTDVRVEQLRAEGVEIFLLPSECQRMFNRFGAVRDFDEKKKEFAKLWDSTIKKADLPQYG